jgi:FkbM family methyltransferase
MNRRALVAYWLSEAPLVLRAKQIALAVLPPLTQVALKRLYYLWVLQHAQMETDTEGVRRLLRGGVALDVGANIGSYTRLLARLADEVIAMEPVPETFGHLRFNLRSLGLRNVRLLDAAASDRDRQVMMEVPRYRRGPEAMTDARVVEQPTKTSRHFTVTAMRIDSLNLNRLDFIKMDVEGHELQAVRGALETIKRFRPAMIIESVFADGDWLYPILEPLGYRGFVWQDGTFRLIGPLERSQNVFFLMPHHDAMRDIG